MRLLGILFGTALAAVIAVQSVSLYKAGQRLETLEQRLKALSGEYQEQRSNPDSANWDRGSDSGPAQSPSLRAPAPAAGATPALKALAAAAQQAGGLAAIAAANDDPLPLPVELSSPQAREQLAGFVRAQIERAREQSQSQRRHDNLDRATESHAAMATKLGLDPNTAGQFTGVLAQVQQQRMDVLAAAHEGTLPRSELREKMRQITQQSDEQVKRLVGDEKFKVYQDLQSEQRLPGGAGRFGGFGRAGAGNGAARGPQAP